MNKVPPVAPVYAKGPLGVVQLPRLWSKVLLDAKGLLPEGYWPCGNGFDKVVLDGLGLDREKVLAYLTTQMPTYAAFEEWIKEQLGGRVDASAVQQINDRILGFEQPDERRAQILGNAGFKDDGTIRTGAQINAIDDWAEFHRYLTQS